MARGSGYTLFLTKTGALLALRHPEQRADNPGVTAPAEQSVLRMKLRGANPNPLVAGRDVLPGKVNYLIGNDSKKWRSQVPTYSKVQYQNVYPGVDLVYYGNQRRLEYDFIVAPGASPDVIALDFDGPEKLELDAQGDLLLHMAGGTVRLHRPVIYQETEGVREEIAGRYIMKRNNRVGFQVAAYDFSKPLVIDPVLVYSGYLGGTGEDQGSKIATDSSGNVYVTGSTVSGDFPIAGGSQSAYGGNRDAFITKFNSQNAIVYSTYLGGSYGEAGNGIAVDSDGNAYVTGYTESGNFPLMNAYQGILHGPDDIFVTKLSADGSTLAYSTYLGGSRSEGAQGIAVDGSGMYITGTTYSFDFPLVNPLQATRSDASGTEAFVAKLNTAGDALVFATYLGGSSEDRAYGIAVDPSGNVYVTGSTYSANFPTANPLIAAPVAEDAFIVKLNPTGTAFVYSTFLGGRGADRGNAIAVDATGNAYVTGISSSYDFPVRNPIQPLRARNPSYPYDASVYDIFVTKISPDGTEFVYSTYLGGTQHDIADAIAVDGTGNAYVTGWTASPEFPLVRPIDPLKLDRVEAFVTRMGPDGSVLAYSTFLGGSNSDAGTGIAVDGSGNAYVTGHTYSSDFPTLPPDSNQPQGGNAFLTKIFDDVPAPEPGPVPSGGRVEENSDYVRYSGDWFDHTTEPNTSGHSGDRATRSGGANAQVILTFEGTGMHWIGFRDEWSGIARVCVDGVARATVDTYASPAEYQANLFSIDGLSQARHTLVIEVLGTKNAASGGAWVWVDAFDIVP